MSRNGDFASGASKEFKTSSRYSIVGREHIESLVKFASEQKSKMCDTGFQTPSIHIVPLNQKADRHCGHESTITGG